MSPNDKVTLRTLRRMKHDGRKIVCVVAWDFQVARIVDRANVDIVSVGDSVGINLWGHATPLEVTLDEVLVVCRAVRRGVSRALLTCDFPYGPLQEGPDAAVRAALRLVKEGGVDMVKLDGAADHPDAVTAVDRAGIPVFAQFGLSPQTAMRHGLEYDELTSGVVQMTPEMTDDLVSQARMLERAGASMLNFTNSGPTAGAAVCAAVSIPVLGGMGAGPWLDGQIRMVTAATGYDASMLDSPRDAYANVAKVMFDAVGEYSADVRAGRQIRGRASAVR